jgi:hypothetical protein
MARVLGGANGGGANGVGLAGLSTTTSTNPHAVLLLPAAPPEDLPQLSSRFQTASFVLVTVSLF